MMNTTSRDAMLQQVNQAGFAMVDANLYLDTLSCHNYILKNEIRNICNRVVQYIILLYFSVRFRER